MREFIWDLIKQHLDQAGIKLIEVLIKNGKEKGINNKHFKKQIEGIYLKQVKAIWGLVSITQRKEY